MLLPLLAGCGFHPLYGDRAGDAPLEPLLASVAVDSVADRPGQMLTNELRDGFNPHALGVPKEYRLTVQLNKSQGLLMTRPDTSAARTDVRVTAKWTLIRLKDHVTVTSGTSSAVVGYDVLANAYANQVSSDADLASALQEVSDDIQTNVALYLRRPKK
jgi:LPS-assembly lipoprotein